MRSLFELISKYKSDVIIVPIIAFVALVVTLFMYIFLNKKKIYKYIPGIATFVIGLILFIRGFVEIIDTAGLDFIDTGSKFFVFAFISLAFAGILDILDSLGRSTKGFFKKPTLKNNNPKKNTKTK